MLKIQPLKGMKDYLPDETALREYALNTIHEVYRRHGFSRITTPMLEEIGNLTGSECGDNLNLIFKVLKRGDKLSETLASGRTEALADMGLRYDLTLPLARFYAANRHLLPLPFKVIQMDRAFRAERPQKGRMREFMQCDIDIIGDDSIHAETELIHVTAKALSALGFENFIVLVNDRRLLNGLLVSFGFSQESLPALCLAIDKADKIGVEGVRAELVQKGHNHEAVDALCEFLFRDNLTPENAADRLADKASAESLVCIIRDVHALAGDKYRVAYHPSLVRGQGYYTGAVFEIICPSFSGSIAGGGRYDGMIGKFTGQAIPAVGFSIGFERVCALLSEKGFATSAPVKIAVLYREEHDFAYVLKKADDLAQHHTVTVFRQAKKLSKQLETLEAMGFASVAFADREEIKVLGRYNASEKTTPPAHGTAYIK
ncbi:MAG: histidine--tRNA ligase [Clostridia bacterium]|nr:histidine--tRNA ligase [Clostridia bacterium]